MHWKLSSSIPLFASCPNYPKITDITCSCFALLHHHQHHYTDAIILTLFSHYQHWLPSAIGIVILTKGSPFSPLHFPLWNEKWELGVLCFSIASEHALRSIWSVLKTKPICLRQGKAPFFPCFWIVGRSMRILLSRYSGRTHYKTRFKFNFML